MYKVTEKREVVTCVADVPKQGLSKMGSKMLFFLVKRRATGKRNYKEFTLSQALLMGLVLLEVADNLSFISALTHFRKTETTRNHPHQNVLVTRTQVKTLHKQQTTHI
jgi:hypothetical protein